MTTDIQFLLYNLPEEQGKVQVIIKDETIWCTQKAMAQLFGVQRPAITKHLGNIFNEGELDSKVVCSKMEHTTEHGAIEGKTQTNHTNFYHLDAIIAVGYRVNSAKATKFRQWATKVLNEYIRKGFVLDDNRLKQGAAVFGKDYFRELLERVRSIRASERRISRCKSQSIVTKAIIITQLYLTQKHEICRDAPWCVRPTTWLHLTKSPVRAT